LSWVTLASPNFVFGKTWTGKEVWLGTVLAGLFLDCFSGLSFGIISFSFVSAVCLVGWLNKNVFSQINFWVLAALVALGTIFYNLLLMILSKLFQPGLVIDWVYLIQFVSIEVFYNIILIWLVLIIYGAKKIFY
jgi:hypothetical protein